MRLITLPEDRNIILPFYLAAEEWAARTLPAGQYFFAWQVEPTVICGRHQDMAAEVDLDYAVRKGIKVWRRKSGGGAVYADYNNIMFSYITPSSDVQTTFGDYTDMICSMLAAIGIHAEATGRNDISINGRKVAGNAFLKLPGRSIVHGTMLYDADFESISHVLTPSKAKRESKGVISVPSRITTLRNEGISLSCSEFIQHAIAWLCKDGAIIPDNDDIAKIKDIMQSYLDPEFLRRNHSCSSEAGYYNGLGLFKADTKIDQHGYIADIELWGDFLTLKPVELLIRHLRGLPPDAEILRKALSHVDVEKHISGLTADILIEVLTSR